MSFRNRLILFFALIVVVPMVAVGLLLTRVADEWRTGKADARLAASVQTGVTAFGDHLDAAARNARRTGRDAELLESLRGGDPQAAQAAVEQLSRELDLSAVVVESPSGRRLAIAGRPNAPASSTVLVRSRREGALGRVRVSTLVPSEYVAQVEDLTGREAVLLRGDVPLAATVNLGTATLPAAGETTDVRLPSGESRASTVAPDRSDPSIRLVVLGPTGSVGLGASHPLIVIGVLAFFALALLFVVLLVRALQGQVRQMLAAARRVGGGDFSHKVPVEGNDEMAGLAREFNTMSERLSEQMAELRGHRAELERSVRRIGEAFAAGHDRAALLEVTAETALDACGATAARVILTGAGGLEAEAGERPAGELAEALRAAEDQALREGTPADATRAAARALAYPLTAVSGARGARGVIAVCRLGPPFDRGEREMLRYLAGQAAVSVENLTLAELVSDDAITDEVTGLANGRHFRELLEAEVRRAERYGHELSLVLLDIDGFEGHREAYGPRQGDKVLREVARVIESELRGTDEPARQGEGEFAIALPETGSEGALRLAERVHTRLKGTRILLVDGSGTMQVTASLGVASLPRPEGDGGGLLAAARAALDQARAGGGNITAVAAGTRSVEHL